MKYLFVGLMLLSVGCKKSDNISPAAQNIQYPSYPYYQVTYCVSGQDSLIWFLDSTMLHNGNHVFQQGGSRLNAPSPWSDIEILKSGQVAELVVTGFAKKNGNFHCYILVNRKRPANLNYYSDSSATSYSINYPLP